MASDSEKYIIRLAPETITNLGLVVFVADEYAPNRPAIGSIKVLIKDRNLEAIKKTDGYYLFLNLPDDSKYTVQTKSDYYFDQEVDITIPSDDDLKKVYKLSKDTGDSATEAELEDVSGLRNGDVLEFDNKKDPPEKRWITLDPDLSTNKIYWDKDIRGGLDHQYAEGTELQLPAPKQQKRTIRIDLKPNSYYPFPSGATLIRGVVQDNYGNAVSKATIKVEMITITIKRENQPPKIIKKTPLEIIGEDIVTFSSDLGDFALYFQLAKLAKFKQENNITSINNIDIMVNLKVTHKDFQDEKKDINILKEQTNSIKIIELKEKT